jgi:hypothetical protein
MIIVHCFTPRVQIDSVPQVLVLEDFILQRRFKFQTPNNLKCHGPGPHGVYFHTNYDLFKMNVLQDILLLAPISYCSNYASSISPPLYPPTRVKHRLTPHNRNNKLACEGPEGTDYELSFSHVQVAVRVSGWLTGRHI